MALNATEVQQLYVAYLGRAADQEGLEYWTSQSEAFTLADLRWSLVNAQEEYQELYGDLSREDLVAAIYQNMFGRAPEAEGLDYWVSGEGAAVPADDLMQLFISAASEEDSAAFQQRVADAIEETEGQQPEVPSVPGETYMLTPNADRGADFVGTENDDTFEAPISTINFVNGNTLNTGDVLDGGAGNDTLRAELINDSFSQSGLGAVRPSTQNIENIEITALPTSYATSVTLDAANMYDVEHIGSYNSNASLVIQDLHTKTSGGGVRNTDAITIRMDHTQNVNSVGYASDLIVLFDENYLLSGQDAEGKALYWLLDQDADLVGDPLLDNINVDGIRFSIDGGETIALSSPDAMAADTHVEFVAALQASLNDLIADGVVPSGTTLELDANQSRTTFLDDGSVSSQVPAIVLTTGDGSAVTPVGYNFVEDEPGEFNLWARFDDTFGVEDLPVTSNIELHKVGRGSEGGDLIVGGKSQDSETGSGVEVFNVTVMGDESKPSHVGVLNSTNGDLRTVNVTTDDAVTGENGYADLRIDDLGGAKGPYASTDVQNFNSTTFEGNLNLTTTLDESGNGAHVYNLGGGDDVLNINMGIAEQIVVDIEGNPIVVSGSAFGGMAGDSLAVSTGAGNDLINISGDADLESLVINAGSGDNTVFYSGDNQNEFTDGQGARIVSGNGDDAIYLNNGVSTSLVNGESGTVALALPPGTAQSFQFFGGKMQVSVDGVESQWVDIDYNSNTYMTSRADIRQAIQDAVNSNPALAGMVEIVEYTDGTLGARSLVSGGSEVNINIQGPVANQALINNDDVSDVDDEAGAGWPLLNGQEHLNTVSLSQLQSAWEAWYPSSDAFDDGNWDSGVDFDGTGQNVGSASGILDAMQFIAEGLGGGLSSLSLSGPENGSTGNVINAGAGDDLIVLNAADGEDTGGGNTVEMTGNFGTNTIVNFNAFGYADEAVVDGDADFLDFTSYLDATAAGRGESATSTTARANEYVPFTFENLLASGDTFEAAEIDHNSMTLVSFTEIWDFLDTDPDSVAPPANFASLSAAQLKSFVEEEGVGFTNASGASSNEATAVGNQFLIFVGQDGDVERGQDDGGDFNANSVVGVVDDAYADNVFKAFQGEVTGWTVDGGYTVSFNELGTIDLADTDLVDLTGLNFTNAADATFA